jgi:lipoprotein signal peptidase
MLITIIIIINVDHLLSLCVPYSEWYQIFRNVFIVNICTVTGHFYFTQIREKTNQVHTRLTSLFGSGLPQGVDRLKCGQIHALAAIFYLYPILNYFLLIISSSPLNLIQFPITNFSSTCSRLQGLLRTPTCTSGLFISKIPSRSLN